jgi:nitric oxide reductase NorQ protein
MDEVGGPTTIPTVSSSASPRSARAPGQQSMSGFTIKSTDKSILHLENDPNFWVKSDNSLLLDVVNDLSETCPQNVLLTGPQGCGKTELSMYFAAKYERPVIIMNCATVRETKDWFGYRDAKDGSIFWHRSDFVRAVEMGGCVIVLDEFNRLHSTLHNSLYPLLDARRSTYVEELGNTIRVGPKTIFFATANIGYTHTGTHAMDSAIEDRFGYRLNVDFPDSTNETRILQAKTGLSEKNSHTLAMFGDSIRRKSTGISSTLSRPVSTRQLIQSGILMKKFIDKKILGTKALDFTILPFYSKEGGKDSERAQVLQLIQGLFGSE